MSSFVTQIAGLIIVVISLAFALGVFFLSLPEEKLRGDQPSRSVPEAAAPVPPRTRDHVHRTAAKPAETNRNKHNAAVRIIPHGGCFTQNIY